MKINGLSLEIPSLKHEAEYARIMDKWESIEDNIQPELMRRYSKKLGANIPFCRWLEYCEDDRTTGSMLSTHVPCTLFFLLNGDEIIGCIVMNHASTYRGHLHSGIVPWHRNKGYGTIMLKLALSRCLEKGMRNVQITTCKSNVGAQKTIIKNGGILLEEFCDDGIEKIRYEIDILKQFDR